MAGSIRSVVTENSLKIQDVTQFWEHQGMSIHGTLLVIRCSGTSLCGTRLVTYGSSVREAVNKWLEFRGRFRKWSDRNERG